MTRREAYERAAMIISSSGIPGMVDTAADVLRRAHFHGPNCQWKVGDYWSVDITVSVQFVGDAVRIKVRVVPGSQGMPTAHARAAARTFADVVDLACRIEAELGDVDLERGDA